MSILVKNGTIIDGTGAEKKKADILVEGDRIKKIGNLGKRADKVIDAGGLFVAPGFIDVNSDSDHYLTLLTNPGQQSFLYQGVTSIIGGNCGASLAPLVKGEIIQSVSKWADISGINVDWHSVSEFFAVLERLGLGVNFGMLCGHTTLRRNILKDNVRELNPDEKLKMRFLLDAALRDGALGMSAGLAYSHAKITPTEELVDLARIAGEANAVFALHLRGESVEILESVREAVEIGRQSKVSVEISHFKISGSDNWWHLADVLQLIEEARKDGLDVNFDVYPYTESASTLYIFFPDWATKGGRRRTMENLADETSRKKIIAELTPEENELKDLKVADARHPVFIGKKLEEIAKNQNVGVAEAAVNLYLANGGEVIVFAANVSEDNLTVQLRHPASFLGSSGAGYTLGFGPRKELIHPRCFGAFPRFLRRFAKEKAALEWEKAIQKITGGPAKKFNLQNRGLLKENYFADIAVFNPEEINDKATFENPFQYSKGVECLFVNGSLAIEKGKYTGKMAGLILKRGI
jgi:N-acyl-D-amino-acid deacylase